jgi:hypothetical protein
VWIVAHREEQGLEGQTQRGQHAPMDGLPNAVAMWPTPRAGKIHQRECRDVAEASRRRESVHATFDPGREDVPEARRRGGEGPGHGERREPDAAWWEPEPDNTRLISSFMAVLLSWPPSLYGSVQTPPTGGGDHAKIIKMHD